MATATAPPYVSVEEYLNSAWHPDLEYVDGVLVERALPTVAHSLLQAILIQFFGAFEQGLRFKALPEVRTRIINRARYRLPDILLCHKPLPKGKIVDVIPHAVIEILSPEDRMSDTLERLRDYQLLGVKHVVQMDPERYCAHRFESGSLIETVFRELAPIPFDSEKIFNRLREERNEE